jgi:hypothetical protein
MRLQDNPLCCVLSYIEISGENKGQVTANVGINAKAA